MGSERIKIVKTIIKVKEWVSKSRVMDHVDRSLTLSVMRKKPVSKIELFASREGREDWTLRRKRSDISILRK